MYVEISKFRVLFFIRIKKNRGSGTGFMRGISILFRNSIFLTISVIFLLLSFFSIFCWICVFIELGGAQILVNEKLLRFMFQVYM